MVSLLPHLCPVCLRPTLASPSSEKAQPAWLPAFLLFQASPLAVPGSWLGPLTLTPQWDGKEQPEWTVRPRQDAEMEVLTQHVFWDQWAGWEFWKKRHTTEQIDRPTYSEHLGRAPAVGLLVCEIWGPWSWTRRPHQSLGRRSQSPLQPSLLCLGGDLSGPCVSPSSPTPYPLLPSWWVGAIWGNRRWSEEGSQSAFLSLSSAPVGFLQVTSSPLNDTLSAYLIMLYQYVHFFHMSIFSGEILDVIFHWTWIFSLLWNGSRKQYLFPFYYLITYHCKLRCLSKCPSECISVGVMVSYSFLTKKWEI